jgi:hypothetical protein
MFPGTEANFQPYGTQPGAEQIRGVQRAVVKIIGADLHLRQQPRQHITSALAQGLAAAASV